MKLKLLTEEGDAMHIELTDELTEAIGSAAALSYLGRFFSFYRIKAGLIVFTECRPPVDLANYLNKIRP
jgi:hypothetical protein